MTIIANPAVPMMPPSLLPVAATPLFAAPAIGFAGLLAAALPALIPAEIEAAAPLSAEAPPSALAPQPAGDAANTELFDPLYPPRVRTPSPAEIVLETADVGSPPEGAARPGRVPGEGRPILPATGSPPSRRPMPRMLAVLDREASPVAVAQPPPEIGNSPILKALPQTPGPNAPMGDSAQAVALPPIVDAAKPQATTKSMPVIAQAARPLSPAPKALAQAAVAAPKSRDEMIEPPVPGDTPAAALPPATAIAVPAIMRAGAPPPLERRVRPTDLAVATVDRNVAAAVPLTPPAPGPERSPGPTAAVVGAPVLQRIAVPDGPLIAPPAARSSPAAPPEAPPLPQAMPVGVAPALAPETDDRTDDGGLVAALPLLVPASSGARLPLVRGVPTTRVAGDAAVDRSAVADPAIVAAPPVVRKADASGIVPVPTAAAPMLPGRIEKRQDERDLQVTDPRGDRSVARPIEAAQRPGLALPLPLAEIPVAGLAPAAIAQTGTPIANAAPGTLALRDPPASLAISVASDQLGAVSIGVDDQAGDLRIRLSGSTAAAGAMTAEAPRLIAELAANGMRLGSLDITGRADALVGATPTGDGRSGQRSPSGAAESGIAAGGAGGGFAGGSSASDGRPAGGDRAPPPAASIAAFTRNSVARDQISRPRLTPSDRYA